MHAGERLSIRATAARHGANRCTCCCFAAVERLVRQLIVKLIGVTFSDVLDRSIILIH